MLENIFWFCLPEDMKKSKLRVLVYLGNTTLLMIKIANLCMNLGYFLDMMHFGVNSGKTVLQ